IVIILHLPLPFNHQRSVAVFGPGEVFAAAAGADDGGVGGRQGGAGSFQLIRLGHRRLGRRGRGRRGRRGGRGGWGRSRGGRSGRHRGRGGRFSRRCRNNRGQGNRRGIGGLGFGCWLYRRRCRRVLRWLG